MIHFRPLTIEDFAPYGWLLGKAVPPDSKRAFSTTDIAFRHEHIFDPGSGGQTEVLWVNYRNRQRNISSLEAHRLCQQVIVPLTGEVIHIVAGSLPDGSPDGNSMSAFRIPVGQGICMRPGCWHTTRVDVEQVTCIMLTRASTTIDLAAHLKSGSSLYESAIAVVTATLPPA